MDSFAVMLPSGLHIGRPFRLVISTDSYPAKHLLDPSLRNHAESDPGLATCIGQVGGDLTLACAKNGEDSSWISVSNNGLLVDPSCDNCFGRGSARNIR